MNEIQFDFCILQHKIDDQTALMIESVPFLQIAKQLNEISRYCGYDWFPGDIVMTANGFMPRISRTNKMHHDWSFMHNLFNQRNNLN